MRAVLWAVATVPLLTAANLAALSGALPTTKGEPPPCLLLVPEMEPFPELKLGVDSRQDEFVKQAAEAGAVLKEKVPEITKRLTPEVVRSLSRWAQKEMKAYDKVPPLDKVKWKAVRNDPKQ